MTDLFTQGANYARMAPAISRNFVTLFSDADKRKLLRARLPSGLRVRDVNPLDPASRSHFAGCFLYSAAFGVQDGDAETIISQRDRSKTLLIGDSGGFSVIKNALSYSVASFRAPSLDYQEKHCDVAMILDVPTESINRPESGYATLDSCWHPTEESLRFALNRRTRRSLKLATVLQGRTPDEAREWFERMTPFFQHVEAIALAGGQKKNLFLILGFILRLLSEGRFDTISHVHVLGCGQPGFGLLLTALKRALSKATGRAIEVSFDSSSAFGITQKYKQLSIGLDYSKPLLPFRKYQFSQASTDYAPGAAFPFRSPLGDRCTMGDFLGNEDPYSRGWDTVGEQMLSNHAVYAEVSAFIDANRLMDMPYDPGRLIPWNLRKAAEGIDAVLNSEESGKALQRYRKYLQAFSAAVEDDPADWDR